MEQIRKYFEQGLQIADDEWELFSSKLVVAAMLIMISISLHIRCKRSESFTPKLWMDISPGTGTIFSRTKSFRFSSPRSFLNTLKRSIHQVLLPTPMTGSYFYLLSIFLIWRRERSRDKSKAWRVHVHSKHCEVSRDDYKTEKLGQRSSLY